MGSCYGSDLTLNQLTAHGVTPSPTPAAAECQEWRISEARRLEPPRSSDGASAAASQHQTPALSAAQPIAIVASLASQPTAAWPLPAAAGQREVQRGGLSRPALADSAAASDHQPPVLPIPTVACRSTR